MPKNPEQGRKPPPRPRDINEWDGDSLNKPRLRKVLALSAHAGIEGAKITAKVVTKPNRVAWNTADRVRGQGKRTAAKAAVLAISLLAEPLAGASLVDRAADQIDSTISHGVE
ncbi:hypothetical protein HYS00_03830, partial [Candidatus Microgenomates bacterium]|nr:hypothetical protein [Candidatus Microgenomates bacterium]